MKPGILSPLAVACLMILALGLAACGSEDPDVIIPVIEILAPTDGAFLSEDTLIEVEASDNEILVRVIFLIDDVEIGEDDLEPYEIQWEIADWADGEHHTVFAVAEDEAGNRGYSVPIVVTVSALN